MSPLTNAKILVAFWQPFTNSFSVAGLIISRELVLHQSLKVGAAAVDTLQELKLSA
jgi:hypothetical protein